MDGATGDTLRGTSGRGPGPSRKRSVLASWLSTTDHKVIGHLYLITSFGFFLIAGLMAMIIRAQLFGPENHVVSDQQYNQLFTMHGAIMLLLFATPLFVGFANEIMPLQIGAPDVAFPRLNILSYWFFLCRQHVDVAGGHRPGQCRVVKGCWAWSSGSWFWGGVVSWYGTGPLVDRSLPRSPMAADLAGAIRLYESCGWVRAGAVTSTFRDGNSLDEYVYLGPPAPRY
jgi:Cytochrome C and Quinol oxidase polypeptide I